MFNSKSMLQLSLLIIMLSLSSFISMNQSKMVTTIIDLVMEYYNLPPVDFPPEFEDKMLEAYYSISHPNLEACNGNGTWTWSNETY